MKKKLKQINKRVDLGIQLTAWLAEFTAKLSGGIVLLTQFDQPYIVGVGVYLLATAALMFGEKLIKGMEK